MKFAMLAATAALVLAGCATQTDPMAKDAAPYVAKPDYEHALVCDTRSFALCVSLAAVLTVPHTACCSCSANRVQPSKVRVLIPAACPFGAGCFTLYRRHTDAGQSAPCRQRFAAHYNRHKFS